MTHSTSNVSVHSRSVLCTFSASPEKKRGSRECFELALARGYGWGRVEDRGGAIRGPDRIDVYYRRRQNAVAFGRRGVDVTVVQPV